MEMKKMSLLLIFCTLFASCSEKTILMPSTDMEATIKKGTELKIHKTKDIRQNHIVAFRHTDRYLGEQVLVLRVVAVPGDTLKIREGQVFINKKLFEEPEQIRFSYQVTVNGDLNEQRVEGMEYVRINSREYVFQLSREEAKRLWNDPAISSVTLMARNPGALQEGIFGANEADPWNADNYGPIKVPEPGEAGATRMLYFVLGDSRHSAIDSRYFGYISEDDILGTVEFQH